MERAVDDLGLASLDRSDHVGIHVVGDRCQVDDPVGHRTPVVARRVGAGRCGLDDIDVTRTPVPHRSRQEGVRSESAHVRVVRHPTGTGSLGLITSSSRILMHGDHVGALVEQRLG